MAANGWNNNKLQQVEGTSVSSSQWKAEICKSLLSGFYKKAAGRSIWFAASVR